MRFKGDLRRSGTSTPAGDWAQATTAATGGRGAHWVIRPTLPGAERERARPRQLRPGASGVKTRAAEQPSGGSR